MLSPELQKLKEALEAEKENINVDRNKLLQELQELEQAEKPVFESLALSDKFCPTCGRVLR